MHYILSGLISEDHFILSCVLFIEPVKTQKGKNLISTSQEKALKMILTIISNKLCVVSPFLLFLYMP